MINNINDMILVQQSQHEPYYETLEYIQLDGTQYFNLGFKSKLGTGYEIGVQFDDLGATGCGVCGSRDNSSASENNIGTFVGSSTSVVTDYNNSSYTGSRYTVPKTDLSTSNWYDVYNYRTGRGIRLNGAEVGTPNTTTATTAFTTVNDFYLGGYNGFNLVPFKGKIKYFKSVNPAMDIIPVLDSQMRPCFYDRIGKRFYYHTNSTGTTTPTYKRWNKFDVDYIQSSGTQYIDTDIYADLNTKCVIDVMPTQQGNDINRICGNYKNTSKSFTINCSQPSNGNNTSRFGANMAYSANSSSSNPMRLTVNERVTVGIGKDGLKKNDTVLISWSDTTTAFTTEGTVAMLASGNQTGAIPDTLTNGLVGNCYGGKWYENNILIRDYKPVIYHNGDRTAEACLYDEVYNKMYTNAGTGSFKAYIENTLGEPYEVGMYLKTIKTSTVATVGPIIELGEYPQDGIGYHIKTTTDSNSSNYLFGSRKTTDGNLQVATLSGSQTGGTILSTIMGESITWKSDTTAWARSANGTTYECSIQTYKDGNTYKFNAIGYNYTLGKEADRQTQTYSSPIDGQQDAPMLLFGAFNTGNILFGSNYHYFVEWNLPDVRHTLLPVINSTHTTICFIDNKTKQTYEFIKVGTYTPATDNITFKQLDGTIITGTL